MLRPILIATVLLLTSCTSTNQMTSKKAINSWEMKAKLALIYPEKDCATEVCKEQSEQGKMEWSQKDNDTNIAVFDPFGKRLFSFTGNDQSGQAMIGGQQQHVSDVQTFFSQQLKMQIEPSSLRHWLTGRADPNYDVSNKTNESFQQNGFSIEARYWRNEAVGNVPTLIIIKKEGYTIRVVVQQWS